MSQCRACGKEILFIRTIAGNSMPCDAEVIRFRPMSRFGNEHNENFVKPDGRVCSGQRDPKGECVGYRTHWASCTKPEEFRRGK
jgi:hypothetical protein